MSGDQLLESKLRLPETNLLILLFVYIIVKACRARGSLNTSIVRWMTCRRYVGGGEGCLRGNPEAESGKRERLTKRLNYGSRKILT
jgi:hypothetical protein